MKKIFLLYFFSLFIFILLSFSRNYLILDPDFGFHFKMGELILNKGIPKTDPFSFTMPTYQVIDHEWLLDIIFYKLYSFSEMLVLALLSTFIILFIFLNQLKLFLKRNALIAILLTSYGFLIYSPFLAVRAQVLSWLFVFILITILFNKFLYDKFINFLPLLFLFWVNLHGSFSAGLVILALLNIGKLIRTKTLNKKFLLISILSFVATLINPYGIRIWDEVWNTASDNYLKLFIAEWQSPLLEFGFDIILYLVLSTTLVFKFFKQVKTEWLIIFLFFLIQAILSQRQIVIFYLITFQIVFDILSNFRISLNKISKFRFDKAVKFLFIFNLFMFSITSFIFINYISNIGYKSSDNYPVKAIEYLKKNPFSGNIFNSYGWGGYLIWKYPERKFFIDGRMPSWRQEVSGKELYIFKDYIDILTENIDFNKIAQKYDINRVLILKEKKKNEIFFSNFDKRISRFLVNKIYGRNMLFNFYEYLVSNGWEIEYEDNVAVIYKKLN